MLQRQRNNAIADSFVAEIDTEAVGYYLTQADDAVIGHFVT